MTRILVPAPPIEADVSAAQVTAYLLARGWVQVDGSPTFVEFERNGAACGVPREESYRFASSSMREAIDDIARAEGRHPSAVLADIVGPAVGSGIPSRGETAECGPGPNALPYQTDINRAKCKMRMYFARQAAEQAAARVDVETDEDGAAHGAEESDGV